MAVAWARVSPSRVNRLAEASSPSLTMGENELRSSVDCISFAMPSSLLRTTSRVIGSAAGLPVDATPPPWFLSTPSIGRVIGRSLPR